MTTKTKTKTEEAQRRSELKRASNLQDREGLATLSAAAAAMKCAHIFTDIDFALGLMMHAADLSSAKKLKLLEAGRAKRLSLLPPVVGDESAVDLVVRIPADLIALPEVTQQLLGLGLRSNRKRTASPFAEYQGRSDETAVRRVAEAVGGTVTAIASPLHGRADLPQPDQRPTPVDLPSKDKLPADSEAPDHEIHVSQIDLTFETSKSGRDPNPDAVATDSHNFGDPGHVSHDWHPEAESGQAFTA